MNHRDSTLQLIDPQTNQPHDPVSVYPFDEMIGAGDKLLLATPERYEVALFDPSTGKVGKSVLVEGGVRGIAFDSATNTLWIGSGTDGTLTHIDAADGRVLDTFVVDGLSGGGSMVATGNKALWVATFGGEIVQVDLAQRRVVTRLKPFGKAEITIASAGGYIWATSLEQPSLLRIGPRTGEFDRRRDIDAVGADFPSLSAATDGTLWVAAAPNRIEELNSETGETLKSYDVPLAKDADLDSYSSLGGITTGYGSVWITIFDDYFEDDALVRLRE